MPSLSTLLDTARSSLGRRRIQRRAELSREIRFADVDGTLIRYRCAGAVTKPCLMLSADPPVVLESYDRLVELLSADFRIVVFEVPGFGLSLPGSGLQFSMGELSKLTEEFIESFGFGPCILALPCLLGFVSIQLANRRSDLISHLILIQQPSWRGALAWRARCDPAWILRSPVLGQVALRSFRAQMVGWWLWAVVADRESAALLATDARRVLRGGGCFCLASIFQNYLRTEPTLSPVEQPTLIIWGQRDRSHGPREHTRAPLLVRGPVHKHVFRSQGHYPELEAPDRFAKLVADFFMSTKEAPLR